MSKHKDSREFFKKVLDELFVEYKNKMRLNKNWSINVKVVNKKDTYAEVVYEFDGRDFNVNVNSKMNKSVASLRDSIIHEFWHVLLTSLTSRMDNILDRVKNKKSINVKKQRKLLKNEEERLVRKFTRIIRNIERQCEKKGKKK